MAQENILIELWFDNYFKTHPILEKDLLEEYNRQLSLTQVGGINAYQYQLTEIQLKTEREIKDVAQQLKLGADWMMLVKSKSAKPENSQKMSLIDWILPSQLIPPLGEVVRQLEIGKFNAIPVKTHLGWHLIRIEEQRAYVMPSFENLKQSITQSLLQKKRQEAVDDLLKRATIERVK
jgi:peptidyl-prolyl cis-trans isomerase C